MIIVFDIVDIDHLRFKFSIMFLLKWYLKLKSNFELIQLGK